MNIKYFYFILLTHYCYSSCPTNFNIETIYEIRIKNLTNNTGNYIEFNCPKNYKLLCNEHSYNTVCIKYNGVCTNYNAHQFWKKQISGITCINNKIKQKDQEKIKMYNDKHFDPDMFTKYYYFYIYKPSIPNCIYYGDYCKFSEITKKDYFYIRLYNVDLYKNFNHNLNKLNYIPCDKGYKNDYNNMSVKFNCKKHVIYHPFSYRPYYYINSNIYPCIKYI